LIEIVQLPSYSMPSTMLQTTQVIRNTWINNMTDEVNIFLFKLQRDVTIVVVNFWPFIYIATTKVIGIVC